MENGKPLVGIIMGSSSDKDKMLDAAKLLKKFGVGYEMTVVSAHRTSERMVRYAETAKERGLKIIIAGAGGAAHLPGMVAAITTLPVIGVPIKSEKSINGLDSLYSIVQMPAGIVVATIAIDNSHNGALLALEILGINDESVAAQLMDYKKELKDKVADQVDKMHSGENGEEGQPNYFDFSE